MDNIINGQVITVNQPQNHSLAKQSEHKKPTINPAEAYIRMLSSEQSRITMTSFLKQVIWILSEINDTPLLDKFGNPIKKEEIGKKITLDMVYWPNLNRNVINEVLLYLKDQGHKVSTIKTYLSAIKGVMREAEYLGYIDEKQLSAIKKLKVQGSTTRPRINTLDLEEVMYLFDKLSDSAIGVRDAAIMAILLGGGLRRAEVAGLRMNNVYFNDQALHFSGKGSKERTVFINDRNWERFIKYMDEVRGYTETIIEEGTGKEIPAPVFGRFWKNGDMDLSQPISPQGVYFILRRLTKELPKLKGLKPHDLRKTFATTLINSGVSINLVRDLLGHASVKTTEFYIGSTEEQLKKAVQTLPY